MDGTPRQMLFVSHASDDAAWVRGALLPELSLDPAGIRTHDTLTPGESVLDAYARAVEESTYTLIILTPAFLADPWGKVATDFAGHLSVERRRPNLVPLLLKPLADDELSLQLRTLVRLDFTDPDVAGHGFATLRDMLSRPPPVDEAIPCPYPGLRPFRERDCERFFGREAEAKLLRDRLGKHRFLAVIGPSGSGKSSLVFAGLLPLLRESGLFPPGDWSMYAMRPGAAPRSAPTEVLEPHETRPGPPFAELAAQPPPGKGLLVVDQFEEVFTAGGSTPEAIAEAVRFQEELLTLAGCDRWHVVITARADFYPDLMGAPVWPAVRDHRVEILPLGDDALRRAIILPARESGVYIEEKLADQLVNDAAGEPGALPLMQEALVYLWEELQGRRFIGIDHYAALAAAEAGNGASRTGLQVAMARHADKVFCDLKTDAERAIARRIFLRLIQFGEGRADTRRQQPLAELRSVSDDRELFDRTLDHLVRNRLLIQGGSAREHAGGR